MIDNDFLFIIRNTFLVCYQWTVWLHLEKKRNKNTGIYRPQIYTVWMWLSVLCVCCLSLSNALVHVRMYRHAWNRWLEYNNALHYLCAIILCMLLVEVAWEWIISKNIRSRLLMQNCFYLKWWAKTVHVLYV